MTSIILVLVGILLATLAALFVVFYGGQAFNSGNTRAAATSLVNMGQNVRHAAELHRLTEGEEARGVDDLVSRGYLAQAPAPGGLGEAENAWREMPGPGGDPSGAYVITGIDPSVCREVNRQATGRDEAPTPEDAMGCADDGPTRYFFVRVARGVGA